MTMRLLLAVLATTAAAALSGAAAPAPGAPAAVTSAAPAAGTSAAPAVLGAGAAGGRRAGAAGAAGAARATGAAAARTSAVRYVSPVPGWMRVIRPFVPPPTPYAAGHRGVDLATPVGSSVLAAGPGTVTFAGSVAGRGVVVIRHPDGVSTEYEPVSPGVRRGAAVSAGSPIGTVSGTHGGCPAQRCLHWGARRGATYFDPLTLLRPLGPVRLLPWPRPGG